MTAINAFTRVLDDTKVHFHLLDLGAATYLWIGGADGAMSALAVALPATKQPAAGTTLLGSSSDVGSQSLAQRLSRRLGRPVFVSLNLPDVAHLRAFAEREALVTQVRGQLAEIGNEELIGMFEGAVVASNFMVYRERCKTNIIKTVHEGRMVFRELGRRLPRTRSVI